jgi:hypothetical protein
MKNSRRSEGETSRNMNRLYDMQKLYQKVWLALGI